MTYLRDGVEYLDASELDVYKAVEALNAARRTTNNSQIARATSLSTTKVAQVTQGLRRRGYIQDVGTGAAYHWRLTQKPRPPIDESSHQWTGERPQTVAGRNV